MAIKNSILSVLGFIFLGLGAVALIVPVMPTTPLVLLAALCFTKGNNKFSGWLQRNRIFGPFIENYRTRQGVSRSLKAASIIFVWTGLIISMAITQKTWISVLLAIVGICVTIHLLLIKTRKEN